MNAIAEPIELLEAECNAAAWHEPPCEETDDALVIDTACSERVLEWTVERICACPSYCRAPQS
jgi:hypothetical protein